MSSSNGESSSPAPQTHFDWSTGARVRTSIETSSPPPLTPSQRPLEYSELAKRDEETIAYSLSLLSDGDTLVFIKYPGEAYNYNATTLKAIEGTHRVHSEALLSTGSPIFKFLLQDEWKQHRMRKSKGFLNKAALPRGISFVLDLTPPDEGEEAVNLITELSCSLGVRLWYQSEERCGVHSNLVGGVDEVVKPAVKTVQDLLIDSAASTDPMSVDSKTETPIVDANLARTAAYETTIQTVLKRSEDDACAFAKKHLQFDPDAKGRHLEVREVLEYCPIRHRAGIQRLLQVIEGRIPVLDSAPKVWTLFALSVYFECPQVVRDSIVSWLLSEPNSQFISTLPEATYKIGNGLQSPQITRPAFAILVSEEALSIATRMEGTHGISKENKTRLGRLKEDIDEDSLNAIQAAANEFHSRIQAAVDNLVARDVPWFETLPEFQKLMAFRSQCGLLEEHKIDILIDRLQQYVRGTVLSLYTKPLKGKLLNEAKEHQQALQYLKKQHEENFQATWLDLTGRERAMTRYFWLMLNEITWSIFNQSNVLVDTKHPDYMKINTEIAKNHQVIFVDMAWLTKSRNEFNSAVLESIQRGDFNDGSVPNACYPSHMNRQDEDVTTPPNWTNSSPTSRKFEPDLEPHDSPPLKKVHFSPSSPDPFVKRVPPEPRLGSSPRLIFTLEVDHGDLPFRSKHDDLPLLSEEPVHSDRRERNDTLEPTRLSDIEEEDAFYDEGWLDFKPRQGKASTSLGIAESSLKTVKKESAGEGRILDAPSPLHHSTAYPLELPHHQKPVIPREGDISEDMPFFSIKNFLRQVSGYVRGISIKMLAHDEVDFRVLTDNLLCLNDNEWKFLPLWAGGNDDGSGGVFNPDMPPALHGPVGPGPSYHTGSTVNSRASSVADWDGGSSIDTSIAVEDGYNDHIDRRVIKSNDSFDTDSIAFTDDSEDYGAGGYKGKGKEVDPTTPTMKAATPTSTASDFDLDMDNDDFMSSSDSEASWDDFDL